MDNQEVAKYRKKKNNSSKSDKKSTHKHDYQDCIVTYQYNFSAKHYARKDKYCVICGKINEHLSITSGDVDSWFGGYKDDMVAKYPELPVFKLENSADNYVKLQEPK